MLRCGQCLDPAAITTSLGRASTSPKGCCRVGTQVKARRQLQHLEGRFYCDGGGWDGEAQEAGGLGDVGEENGGRGQGRGRRRAGETKGARAL